MFFRESCVLTLGSQLLVFCYVVIVGLEFSVLKLTEAHLPVSQLVGLKTLIYGTFRRWSLMWSVGNGAWEGQALMLSSLPGPPSFCLLSGSGSNVTRTQYWNHQTLPIIMDSIHSKTNTPSLKLPLARYLVSGENERIN